MRNKSVILINLLTLVALISVQPAAFGSTPSGAESTTIDAKTRATLAVYTFHSLEERFEFKHGINVDGEHREIDRISDAVPATDGNVTTRYVGFLRSGHDSLVIDKVSSDEPGATEYRLHLYYVTQSLDVFDFGATSVAGPGDTVSSQCDYWTSKCMDMVALVDRADKIACRFMVPPISYLCSGILSIAKGLAEVACGFMFAYCGYTANRIEEMCQQIPDICEPTLTRQAAHEPIRVDLGYFVPQASLTIRATHGSP